MTIVYICHPIAGAVGQNLAKIRKIVRLINTTSENIVPCVPYYADCVSMDDAIPVERARGIKNNTECFNRGMIDQLWVCCEFISKGMYHEIMLAFEKGIRVKWVLFEYDTEEKPAKYSIRDLELSEIKKYEKVYLNTI